MHITILGAFGLEPPVEALEFPERSGGGWRISPSGRLLYVPSDVETYHPFQALERLAREVFAPLGSRVTGEVRWRSEDGVCGTATVADHSVLVVEDPPEELAPAEQERIIASVLEGSEKAKLEALACIRGLQLFSPTFLAATISALRDPAREVRMSAANTLVEFGPRAAAAVPGLEAALLDSEPWVQAAAAEALGAIGSAASKALPALRELLEHPSYGPRGRAQEAIHQVSAAKGSTD